MNNDIKYGIYLCFWLSIYFPVILFTLIFLEPESFFAFSVGIFFWWSMDGSSRIASKLWYKHDAKRSNSVEDKECT